MSITSQRVDGWKRTTVQVRPLNDVIGVGIDQQNRDLDTAEGLLLLHLRSHGPKIGMTVDEHCPAPQRLEESRAVERAMRISVAIAPQWTLDHRVWRTHHQPVERKTIHPDGTVVWSAVPCSTDNVTRPRWNRFMVGLDWFNLPLSQFPAPPDLPPTLPLADSGATIVFHVAHRPGNLSHFNLALRAAKTADNWFVQSDAAGAQRVFRWDAQGKAWEEGLSGQWPRDPLRFVVAGHATVARCMNQQRLLGLSPQQLVDRMQRFSLSLAAALPGPSGGLKPSHISLLSCKLETLVCAYSYGAEVQHLAAERFLQPGLTVSVRSRDISIGKSPSAHMPAQPIRYQSEIVLDDESFRFGRQIGGHERRRWAKDTPRTTWLLRAGPHGLAERADKYPHGGKAWVSDELLECPPPSDELIRWLKPRPSDRPGRLDRPVWESDRSHVMLGEVWIGVEVLRRMGATLEGQVPADAAELSIPGTYARLRFDPCRLISFVRDWPTADEMIPALRLLRQLIRDDVPPLLTTTRPTASGSEAALGDARRLLQAVAASVSDNLTFGEPLWRHLQ